jgi:hypothetical protein
VVDEPSPREQGTERHRKVEDETMELSPKQIELRNRMKENSKKIMEMKDALSPEGYKLIQERDQIISESKLLMGVK